MGRLFVFFGPSVCGKTTLVNGLAASNDIAIAPKYSERERRSVDDDIIYTPSIEESNCDLRYVINDVRYGIDLGEIRRLLESPRDFGIVLSDLRVVRRLKRAFGTDCLVVYVARPIDPETLGQINVQRHGFNPELDLKTRFEMECRRLQAGARLGAWHRVGESLASLTEFWRQKAPGGRSLEVRTSKIGQFHSRYIDNIAFFDHVVLNFGSLDQFLTQGRNLLKRVATPAPSDRTPPIFVVCAAPGSGKGTLMENLNIMGTDAIRIVQKMAKRDPEETDRRDGMVAIGADGEFPDEVDWRWTFHSKRTEYGVSTAEIKRNMNEGVAQIFVANPGQIGRARDLFGARVVVLYLHSAISSDVLMGHFVQKLGPDGAQARVESRTAVFESYVEQICAFDHVLLNTSYPEDLFDQMYRLIDHYSP